MKPCSCPARCPYCGAKLKRDWIGCICPTKGCKNEGGVKGCQTEGRLP